MNIGVSHPVCAPYKETGTTVTYDPGWVMGAAISISPSPETYDEPFYADNTEYLRDKGTSGGTITEEITGMKPQKYAQLMGHTYEEGDGGFESPERVRISKDDSPISVGHGYVVSTVDKVNGQRKESFMVVWFNKVIFGEPNDAEGSTKTESIEYSTLSLEGAYSADVTGAIGEKTYFDKYESAVSYLDNLAGITE